MQPIRVRWLGEKQTEVFVHGGHRLQLDDTTSTNGHSAGASPGELLMAAVASCMCLAVAHIAQKRRLPVGEISVEAEGDVDYKVFRLKEIRLTVHVELPEEELEPLVEVARRYCYVSNTLAGGCPVSMTVQRIAPMEAST